jgi:uncharacterized protein (TIGR03437 family)
MPRIPCFHLCAILLLAGQTSAEAQELLGSTFRLEPVARQVFQGTHVTHAGDGSGRIFAVTQLGEIRIVKDGELLPTVFLDIRPKVLCCSENGLLSVAFHPQYADNGRFFVYYSSPDVGDDPSALFQTLVSEFRVSDDPDIADPESERIILQIPQLGMSHNGGRIAFGPDGMLYVGLGDGGDDERQAQNRQTLHGSILRIDVDAAEGYAVPADNPFVGEPDARDEIWAYGLRNPWRFSFDRDTGDMFIGDVGSKGAEEINFLPAGVAGLSFGWNLVEGRECRVGPQAACEDPGLSPPIFEYGHPDPAGCSGAVVGGYRYRGALFPQLQGLYFFGDYCKGTLSVLRQTASGWQRIVHKQTDISITSFGEDEDGELYVVDFNGVIYRIGLAETPAPSLTSLSTALLAAGAPGAEVLLGGENFTPLSEVLWNGRPRDAELIDQATLRVRLLAEDLAEATLGAIVVSNGAPGGGLSETLALEVVDPGEPAPAPAEGGTVNAASFAAGERVAPGSLVSIFGAGISLGAEQAAFTPLPVVLGGASALVQGVEAPLFFSSEGQMNVQIPWEAGGLDEAELQVRVGPVLSEPVIVPLAMYGPGLFTLDSSGAGQAAALIAGPEVVAAAPEGALGSSRPVRPGEYLILYANGLGPVENAPATGRAASVTQLSPTLETPVVTFAGEPGEVTFSGLTPGFVGLYQVNVLVPEGIAPGNEVIVELEIGGVRSNSVTVAVGAP